MGQFGLFVLVLLSISAALVLAQNDPKCGTKRPPPPSGILGIRNGTDARPNEFPWVGLLGNVDPVDDSVFLCGASILNNQWALTAAHCVWDHSANKPGPVENLLFAGGAHHMNQLDPTTVLLSAIKIIAHESYDPSTHDNDVALLKLNETLDLGLKQFGTICLPEKQDIDLISNHDCIATGWGSLDKYNDPALPDVLQKLVSNVWLQNECIGEHGSQVTDRNLCWGEADKGICSDDSGDPLVCYVDGKWYQYGVASFVTGKTHGGCMFSVFARTSEYSKWIWEKIRAN